MGAFNKQLFGMQSSKKNIQSFFKYPGTVANGRNSHTTVKKIWSNSQSSLLLEIGFRKRNVNLCAMYFSVTGISFHYSNTVLWQQYFNLYNLCCTQKIIQGQLNLRLTCIKRWTFLFALIVTCKFKSAFEISQSAFNVSTNRCFFISPISLSVDFQFFFKSKQIKVPFKLFSYRHFWCILHNPQR